jgi:hypothetical protein
VTHALHVLEEQLGRVVEVDVRLRRAVDHELERARHETVGPDLGMQPALESDRRMLGHASRVDAAGATVLT